MKRNGRVVQKTRRRSKTLRRLTAGGNRWWTALWRDPETGAEGARWTGAIQSLRQKDRDGCGIGVGQRAVKVLAGYRIQTQQPALLRRRRRVSGWLFPAMRSIARRRRTVRVSVLLQSQIVMIWLILFLAQKERINRKSRLRGQAWLAAKQNRVPENSAERTKNEGSGNS